MFKCDMVMKKSAHKGLLMSLIMHPALIECHYGHRPGQKKKIIKLREIWCKSTSFHNAESCAGQYDLFG